MVSTREVVGSAPILSRPRLEERLDSTFGKRLTTLVAGPGYGKSTLIEAWCGDIEHVWLSLTAADTHPDRFIRSLMTALRPHVGPSADAVVPAAHGVSEDVTRVEIVAGMIGESLAAALEHDLVLVLDDVHELSPGSEAARLLESLCRQAPPTLHVMMACRSLPPIRLQRLRGRGEVLELTSADLAFTPAEVEELVERRLGAGNEPVARRLHEATGGWPAAVSLALDAARAAGRRDELMAGLDRLARREGPLYAYLAEEVFAAEPRSLRNLLRGSALFERVTVELCETLGWPHAAQGLEDLTLRGLAQRQADGWFALHRLVRDFATRAWPLEEKEAKRLRILAAAWFEGQESLDAAVEQLVLAGELDRIVVLLRERGDELLGQAGPDGVLRLEEVLRGRQLGETVERLLGEAHMLRGESMLALQWFERAAGEDGGFPEPSPGGSWPPTTSRTGWRRRWQRGGAPISVRRLQPTAPSCMAGSQARSDGWDAWPSLAATPSARSPRR